MGFPRGTFLPYMHTNHFVQQVLQITEYLTGPLWVSLKNLKSQHAPPTETPHLLYRVVTPWLHIPIME